MFGSSHHHHPLRPLSRKANQIDFQGLKKKVKHTGIEKLFKRNLIENRWLANTFMRNSLSLNYENLLRPFGTNIWHIRGNKYSKPFFDMNEIFMKL